MLTDNEKNYQRPKKKIQLMKEKVFLCIQYVV